MDFSGITNILQQYTNSSPAAPPPNVEQDYLHVAQNAPQSHVADGLTDAFRSDQTPPFGQMMGRLFSNSNGQQRAGILNQLLASVGPSLLGSAALSGLGGLLHGGQKTVTPEQAEQVSPQAVEEIAEHAQRQNPSVVEQAGQYYSQHPKLVQALGATSLAYILSRMSRR